jgi:tRNA uridine 5-carbamoylmethylation protein Kti12
MKLANTIIYLIGIPAAGKLTTAKAIAQLTGAKVVDNQLINGPIFTVIGYDGTDRNPVTPEAWKRIEKIRRVVLSFIESETNPDSSFIFTNVMADLPGDRALFRRIERIAKKRKGTFVPIWLTCGANEIRGRKNNPDRRERMKETDPEKTRYWTEEFKELEIRHPNALKLDTTHSNPAETAKQIIAHARRIRRRKI